MTELERRQPRTRRVGGGGSVDRTRFETYCDGPPVAQLTDGVGQDESGEPEDCQQLWEEKEEEQNKTGHRPRERIIMMLRDLLAVSKAHKDVKEGGAVVVVQNFSLQLLLNPTVNLRHNRRRKKLQMPKCLPVLRFSLITSIFMRTVLSRLPSTH